MDFSENSPLVYLYNLGKLFLVFEKIYSLKRENDLLKKNGIKTGDQNVEIYQTNSVKLETITTELLKRGKDIYDKLNDEHKMYLKPYLHTFKMTRVERPLCFSTVNGFPYCTCNHKHKTYLHDLYDLYNQLKLANDSLRSVKSINKNLKKELSSLSIEFGALRTQIFDYNCSVEVFNEGDEEHICMNNKQCREKIKSYINEANETISECLDMAMSKACDCSIEKCSRSKEQDIVSVQITEILSEDEKNIGENVIDEINISVTKSQSRNNTKRDISKQRSQDSISSNCSNDNEKTEEETNDENAKKEMSDEDESENNEQSDNDSEQYDVKCEARKLPDEIEVEIVHERTTVKNDENTTKVNETEKYGEPDILISYKTYVYKKGE